MNTPTLALTIRSLRESARSWSTHALRAALIGTILLALVISQSQSAMFGAPGHTYFSIVVSIDLIAILLIGVGVFSGVITEEKESQTLGLLKLTGMDPLFILLGKSAGVLLNAAILLLVQVPFTLLAIGLGGLSLVQIVASYAVLISFTVCVYCLALLCSVICQRSASAARLTLGAYALIAWGPNLLQFILIYLGIAGYLGPGASGLVSIQWPAWLAWLGEVFVWIYTALPGFALIRILSTGFTGPVIGYPFYAQLIAGAFFFLIAWRIFERATRNEQPPAPERPLLLFRGESGKRASARAWKNPFAWKEYRFVAGGLPAQLLLFVVLGLIFGLLWYLVRYTAGPEESMGGLIAVVSFYVLLIQAAILSSRLFGNEVRDRTLTMLAMLPTRLGFIAYSKARGAAMQLIPTLIWLLIGLLFVANEGENIFDPLNEPGFWYSNAAVFFAAHLVVYLSLWLRRGALPLTICLMLVGNMFGAMLLSGTTSPDAFEHAMAVAAVFLVIGSFILQLWIGKRLAKLASD